MIKENNKIIAEFLGLKKTNYEVEDLWSTVEYLTDNPESTLACSVPIDTTPPFHISWDCLMAVVDKIEEMDIVASFQIEQPTIYIWASSESDSFEDIEVDIFDKTKIEAVYEAVVKFINFYNKQKEK